MREVVIAGFLRTAQSRSRPNDPPRDWFHKVRSDDLLAKLLPEVIKRTGIKAEEIDDFIVGSAIGVSEHWSYGGRFPIFLANLPQTIAAKFVDQQCGSAMAGIHIGFMEIALGFADTVMVGGMEHMTRVAMGAVARAGRPHLPEPAPLHRPVLQTLGHDDHHEHGADRGKALCPERSHQRRHGQMGGPLPSARGQSPGRRFLQG